MSCQETYSLNDGTECQRLLDIGSISHGISSLGDGMTTDQTLGCADSSVIGEWALAGVAQEGVGDVSNHARVRHMRMPTHMRKCMM